MIVAIIILALIGFWTFFFIAVKKQGAEQDQILDGLREKVKGISEIGKIEYAETTVVSVTNGGYLRLHTLSRIFKRSLNNEYWIEVHLENNTSEDVNFILKKVELCSNNMVIESDMVVLFEKVPEWLAPPYGNRYYDTRSFNNFFLGEKAQRVFIFNCRFNFGQINTVKFKDSDFIKMHIEFNRLDKNIRAYINLNAIELIEGFGNMRFRIIQLADEEIKILDWDS